MPQMMPLNWLMLYLYFVASLFLILIFLYSLVNYKNNYEFDLKIKYFYFLWW